MKKPSILRSALLLGLVIANISCDQISKTMVRDQIEYGEIIELIGQTFILTKVENTGAFLSAGSDLPPVIRDILLIYLPIVVMVLVLGFILMQKKQGFGILLGMAFVLGGGIGNLIDRIAYGSVTDFMHIDLDFARTGVFNFADVSIMIGLGIVLLFSFLDRKDHEKPDTGSTEAAAPSS